MFNHDSSNQKAFLIADDEYTFLRVLFFLSEAYSSR